MRPLQGSVRSQARPRSADGPGRCPDFFTIGHPKCGTTALYAMLKRHPQVYLSEMKEPQFFARDLRIPVPGQTMAGPSTYEEYLALFAAARDDQLIGDFSTRHIWSPTAAARIAEAQPEARIVALLREPASFLRSLHLQLLQNRSENEPSLRKAIALEAERREGRSLTRLAQSQPLLLMYTERARYLEQLRRYHAAFAREQVLVLVYEDFREDNEGTLRQVERFLGIDDTVPFEAIEANQTVQRRVAVDDALLALAHGRGGLALTTRRAVRLITPARLRRGAFRQMRRRAAFTSPPAPDEDLMLELRRRFKPEVQALSEYLDRDLLTLWGYERV